MMASQFWILIGMATFIVTTFVLLSRKIDGKFPFKKLKDINIDPDPDINIPDFNDPEIQKFINDTKDF